MGGAGSGTSCAWPRTDEHEKVILNCVKQKSKSLYGDIPKLPKRKLLQLDEVERCGRNCGHGDAVNLRLGIPVSQNEQQKCFQDAQFDAAGGTKVPCVS